MRGADRTTGSLFSYVDIEAHVPTQHPLRLIRRVVNEVLLSLDAEFAPLYEPTGRDAKGLGFALENALRHLLQPPHQMCWHVIDGAHDASDQSRLAFHVTAGRLRPLGHHS